MTETYLKIHGYQLHKDNQLAHVTMDSDFTLPGTFEMTEDSIQNLLCQLIKAEDALHHLLGKMWGDEDPD